MPALLNKLERIEISREQFAKLIEMCDDLFPGHHFLDSQGENQMYLVYSTEPKTSEAICWFELCIVDIPKELAKRIDRPWQVIIELWLYNQEQHLIDYLYSLFKD